MNSDAFLSLLQFSDGLFPAGSYAHSFGLESYVADGTVRNAQQLRRFLLSHLQGSVAPTDVVAALSSRKAALLEPPVGLESCLLIDRGLEAMKLGSEQRAASRQMGRQVLRIAANLTQQISSNDVIERLFSAVENDETPGHHAMAFGAAGAVFGWPEPEMACALLYATCAGLVAAALRLLCLGQLAGQQVLWSLAPAITTLVEEVQGKEMADVWSFAPGIEIASMRHATLDARLFRS